MPGRTRTSSPDGRRADAVGLGLVAALGAWTWVVAGGGAGRPLPFVLLLAGLVAAVALGRALARVPGLAGGVVAASIGAAVAVTHPGILQAGGAPTGYANSNTTLAGVGAIAAVGAARAATGSAGRRGWVGVAAGLVVAAAVAGSVAGLLALALAGGLLAWALLARWPPAVLAGGLVATSAGLGITVALARHEGAPSAALDGVRTALWAAAADLVREAPWRGLGAGGFEVVNPVSRDADLRWVHHEYLELAVEVGVVGLALVLCLAGWTMARLGHATAIDPGAASVAGAACTLVLVHGAVDHVWHAPQVLLLAAVLVGDATGRRRSAAAGPIGPLSVT